MNKTDLVAIAKKLDHDAVKGYTQMNKDHLIEAICQALNIPAHEHHDVVGIDKTTIKQKIHQLKKDRDTALAARESEKFKAARKEIKLLKHQLRKATI